MRKFGLSLIALVLLVSVNFLAYKLPWRWDLTKSSQHTLSQNTIDILNSLDREVELTAFYVGIPPKYLSDLLHEFERNSNGKIKTEIIDQIVQIGYAA
ncbi:MAG: Gldg family protein, partial [Nitrospirota bacterium]|nr:Gldg family protein [Nitrospirota bacterium]